MDSSVKTEVLNIIAGLLAGAVRQKLHRLNLSRNDFWGCQVGYRDWRKSHGRHSWFYVGNIGSEGPVGGSIDCPADKLILDAEEIIAFTERLRKTVTCVNTPYNSLDELEMAAKHLEELL